eukprot:732117-Pyramimonas_sp.AAC.1
MFGTLPTDERPQFDYMGRLTACANPRARMFNADLEALQSLGEGETLFTRLQGSFSAFFWDKTSGGDFCAIDFTQHRRKHRTVAIPPPEYESRWIRFLSRRWWRVEM